MRSFAAGVVVAGVCGVVVASPKDVRAEGRSEPARVVDQWRAAGADAALVPSRFIFDDETIRIAVPADTSDRACTTVAIIGPRGLSFRARLDAASSDPLAADPQTRGSSVAGVLELRRCSSSDKSVKHVLVQSDAGRGAIDVVVARSASELPALASVLPERTGGLLPPVPEPGLLPPLTPPEKRADVAEARSKRDGAHIGPRATFRAGDTGVGDGELALVPGCHRIELFARDPRSDRPGRRFRLDLDAELRDPEDDHVLARDRTEAPDARVETCVGESTPVNVVFAGAPPESTVIATISSWPLPNRLPSMWGSGTTSRMARAFFTRHVAAPASSPIFLAQGSTGMTPFAIPVEVGACYVAVVALSRGHARTLQLRALIGARESSDERGAADEAALTAFCARESEKVRLEVFIRGPGAGFGLAVFRVQSGVWEQGR